MGGARRFRVPSAPTTPHVRGLRSLFPPWSPPAPVPAPVDRPMGLGVGASGTSEAGRRPRQPRRVRNVHGRSRAGLVGAGGGRAAPPGFFFFSSYPDRTTSPSGQRRRHARRPRRSGACRELQSSTAAAALARFPPAPLATGRGLGDPFPSNRSGSRARVARPHRRGPGGGGGGAPARPWGRPWPPALAGAALAWGDLPWEARGV